MTVILNRLVAGHDAPEEVLKTREAGFCGFFGCFLGELQRRFLLVVCVGTTQATVVVELRVAVRVREDDAALAGSSGSDGGGWRKLCAGGVIGMAAGLGWSLDLLLGVDRGAVFVIVHIAVVALLGLAADAKLVADLIDRLAGGFWSYSQQVKALHSKN